MFCTCLAVAHAGVSSDSLWFRSVKFGSQVCTSKLLSNHFPLAGHVLLKEQQLSGNTVFISAVQQQTVTKDFSGMLPSDSAFTTSKTRVPVYLLDQDRNDGPVSFQHINWEQNILLLHSTHPLVTGGILPFFFFLDLPVILWVKFIRHQNIPQSFDPC